MKRKVAYIITVQLIAIAALGFYVIQKKQHVLGVASISPISKESIVLSPNSELKYFYEPKPNFTIKDDRNNTPNQSINVTNNDTLFSVRNYSEEKPGSVFRIVVLGDSFTYALYVDTKEAWPSLLENKLNSLSCKGDKNYEVINLAVGGYDSRFEVERFKRRGVKYNPDLVIWLHVDLPRVRELLGEFMDKFVKEGTPRMDPSGRYKYAYQPWIKAEGEVLRLYGYSKLIEYNKNAIESMGEYYKGKLIIVPMPGEIKDSEKKILKDITNKNHNWIYFDGLRNIYDLGGSYLPDDSHPNKKGHQMISEDIFNFLKENNIVSCK